MENIQLFIDCINASCDDGEFWVKQTIETLDQMTQDELAMLDEELGKDEDLFMNDLLALYDCGDLDKTPPAIVCAAFEWLVGPFEVSRRDYDPFWYREKQS